METLWKPTLLLSKKILTAGMACIFIARKSDGTWSLLIQVLVAKEVIKYWTVTIEVSDFKNPDAPVFTFKGKPISQELSPKEAFETGHIMILKDNQIKPFVIFFLIIFILSLFPDIEIQLNSLTNVYYL